MTSTYLVFLGYTGWTMLLLLLLASYRVYLIVTRQHSARFKADGSDVSELGFRITRVQANCVESFPFIGGLLLFAIATGNQGVTDGLAVWLLAARLGQSLVHLWSVSGLAIRIRFVFFLIQFVICAIWLVTFIQHYAGVL